MVHQLDEQNRCYYNETVIKSDFKDFLWNKGFETEKVIDVILEKCAGKVRCSPKIGNALFKTLAKDRDYDKFLFAQVSCEQDDDSIFYKSHCGLIVAMFGVFICSIFLVVTQWIYNIDVINDKIYDLDLITVSDYTVSCAITDEVYANFVESLNGDTETAVR